MIVWTPILLGVLYASVLFFCICTCLAQLSMFHMERHSRNTFIIVIIIIVMKVRVFRGWYPSPNDCGGFYSSTRQKLQRSEIKLYDAHSMQARV